MGTDFFDSDLEQDAPRSAPVDAAPSSGIAGESFHSRSKRELPERLASAGDEIERLKQRQEALEKRKQEIIELRRRMDMFEGGRRDILDKLRRDAVLVVREGEQASRTAALCTEAGSLFSRLHGELEAMAPDTWGEDEYEARLTEAIAKVDAATAEHRKTMDRVAAVDWRAGPTDGDASAAIGGQASGRSAPMGFGRWFIAGLAFSLPFAILAALIVAAVIYLGRAS